MDPVVILAGLILFGMSILLVGSPLFRKEDVPQYAWDSGEELSNGETSKNAVFTTLAEIEFDYRMGKMNEDDYNELKQKYQPGAVKMLQAEEKAVGKTSSLAAEVEQELAKELERELAEIRHRAKKGQEG